MGYKSLNLHAELGCQSAFVPFSKCGQFGVQTQGFELISIRYSFFVLIGAIFEASLQVDDVGEIIHVYASFIGNREVDVTAR